MSNLDNSKKRDLSKVALGTGLVAMLLASFHLGLSDSTSATAAAMGMLLLPWILAPKDPSPSFRCGWKTDLVPLLKWTVVLVPLFLFGFHLWQDQILNRQLSPEFSTERLERFEPDLRLNADLSNTWDPLAFIDDPSQPRNVFSLWSRGSTIYMLGNRDTGKPFQVEVQWRGGASHQNVQNLVLKNTGAGTRPNLYGADPGGMVFHRDRTHTFAVNANRGWILSGPGRTGLKITNRSHSTVLLRTPSGPVTIDSSKSQNFDRSIMWIWMMALIQIIAIALPEEFFFRGFVQPTLARHMGRFRIPGLKFEISWAIIAASALFALVHLVVIPDPFRLAVFFPGIIFGLMYERSGSLMQPILFHAGSNVFLALCNGIWGLSG